MAMAVKHKLEVHQMDVTIAYLNGDIEQDIYMEIPQNFKETMTQIAQNNEESGVVKTTKKWLKQLNESKPKVCKIEKAIYGLKQSGRQWFKKLDGKLKHLGMKQLNSDPCIYIAKTEGDMMIVAIYGDDIIIASSNTSWIKEMKKKLEEQFTMKDMGRIPTTWE